jgi:hypothetical protein
LRIVMQYEPRMMQTALEALVAQIRSLPGEAADLGMPRAAATTSAGRTVAIGVAELRTRAAAWLTALAAAVETSLPPALTRATQAWDQADAFAVLDGALRDEALALRHAGEALATSEDAATGATGVETRLLVDAAVGLVVLVERRFAAILRLRLRSGTPELVVDGRPFLDVAAALFEAGRRWV